MALRPTLAHLLPLHDVGLFSFASSLASIPNLLSSAVDLVLAPVYFRGRESSGSDEFHAKMLDFGTIYAASMLPVWVFAMLFCPEIIRVIAGPRYMDAVPVTAILLCASYVRFQLPFLLRQIHFLRRTWLQPAITIPWGFLPIVATVLFAGRYGIVVGGWSTLAAEFGVLISTALAIRHHEPLGYPIITGTSFSFLLALLAGWVAMNGIYPGWPEIALKLSLSIVTTAGCMLIWVWPKRRLVMQLASS
jgi:O-antigen/teichoic acid export membrane protein